MEDAKKGYLITSIHMCYPRFKVETNVMVSMDNIRALYKGSSKSNKLISTL